MLEDQLGLCKGWLLNTHWQVQALSHVFADALAARQHVQLRAHCC